MLVDAVAVLSIRCNQCIIWQAAIYTYGELTNSFFWLVEFSVGVLVLQITDFQECALLSFPFCKLQISILQIISIFPFPKLQNFISFRFVSQITVNPYNLNLTSNWSGQREEFLSRQIIQLSLRYRRTHSYLRTESSRAHLMTY